MPTLVPAAGELAFTNFPVPFSVSNDNTRVAYVGRATAPFLFQFGRRDTLAGAGYGAYAAAAKRATVKWYPVGHELCPCATRDRKAWLVGRLAP